MTRLLASVQPVRGGRLAHHRHSGQATIRPYPTPEAVLPSALTRRALDIGGSDKCCVATAQRRS
jgi:hypothetical protein